MLYVIVILMLLSVIPICEHIVKLSGQSSKDNYLIVLIFDIAVGYFCMSIAVLLRFNVLLFHRPVQCRCVGLRKGYFVGLTNDTP